MTNQATTLSPLTSLTAGRVISSITPVCCPKMLALGVESPYALEILFTDGGCLRVAAHSEEDVPWLDASVS